MGIHARMTSAEEQCPDIGVIRLNYETKGLFVGFKLGVGANRLPGASLDAVRESFVVEFPIGW